MIIKNGFLINPLTNIAEVLDIRVENGIIEEIGILDAKENAICVIQTTKVTVVPFHKVSADHAFKEGEGDKSLQYWKDVHEEVFTKWLAEAGLEFTEEMPVVCEEFKVVFHH